MVAPSIDAVWLVDLAGRRRRGKGLQMNVLRIFAKCLISTFIVYGSICGNGFSQDRDADSKPGTDELNSLWSRPGEDWSLFLGPTGNGRSKLRGLVVPWAETGPEVCWTIELGEGYCGPSVSKGRAIVFDRIAGDERLRCVHAETGELIWEERSPTGYVDMFGYDGGPRSSPILCDGYVISYGAEGLLACRRLVDGSLQWKVETGKEFHVVPNFFGVGASPVIYKTTSGSQRKLVIVQVGGSASDGSPADPQRLDLVKGFDSGLVAFDIENGSEVWRTSNELASYSTPLLNNFDGEVRLLAWMRDRLLLIDPESGAVKDSFFWRAKELFSVVAASPVVHAAEVLLSETYGPGSVLLGVENDLFVERRRDPPRSRHRNSLRCHWATPVLHDGCVYGTTGRNAGDALFVCTDWRTGELHWKEPGLGRAGCVLVDGVLIVLSEFGELLVIKASKKTCEIISRCELVDRQTRDTLLSPPCWASPVVAHGYLYIRGAGKLVCIDLMNQ